MRGKKQNKTEFYFCPKSPCSKIRTIQNVSHMAQTRHFPKHLYCGSVWSSGLFGCITMGWMLWHWAAGSCCFQRTAPLHVMQQIKMTQQHTATISQVFVLFHSLLNYRIINWISPILFQVRWANCAKRCASWSECTYGKNPRLNFRLKKQIYQKQRRRYSLASCTG